MRVNIGSPVVRTDGGPYGHVITKFSRMGRLPHFLSYGALPGGGGGGFGAGYRSAKGDSKRNNYHSNGIIEDQEPNLNESGVYIYY